MRPSSWNIEHIVARDGTPSLMLNGKLVHSKFAPIAEAKRWAEQLPESDAYVVVGGGLGYGIEALLALRPSSKVVVIEPVDELIQSLRNKFHSTNGSLRIYDASRRIHASASLQQIISFTGGDYTLVEGVSGAMSWDNSGIVSRLQFHKTLKGQPPRVLVVSPMYGGSYPVAISCVRALSDIGCKVELLDNALLDPARREIEQLTPRDEHRQQLTALLTNYAAERLVARAAEFHADVVLGLAQAPITGSVWKELRSAGIATAFWFVEDHLLFPYYRGVAPEVDLFCTIQRGEWCEQLSAQGAFTHYLPMAADNTIHHPILLNETEYSEYGSDVSFVGAGYYNRRNAFLSLLDFDFKIWGDGWRGAVNLYPSMQRDGARISSEESSKIFQASRVNVNLHSSTYHQEINPDGDFVNPRTFEIAACGAFQVVDHRSLLSELFSEDELSGFTSISEMRLKIQAALDSDSYRNESSERARRRVMQDHLYTHRMEEVLGRLFLKSTPLSHREQGQVLLTDWREQAKCDPELTTYLKRFDGLDQITLQAIHEEIESRNEPLSRVEAVFLLMYEFYQWGKERGVIQ